MQVMLMNAFHWLRNRPTVQHPFLWKAWQV